MRDLLAREAVEPASRLAVAMYCYEIKKRIGAYAAALGGIDTLVFSGGIGEHAPAVRSRICSGLAFLGIQLDESLNQANAPVISDRHYRAGVTVRVIANRRRTDDRARGPRNASVEAMTDHASDLLSRIDAYWRAANYLSVGQIYLLDNPLLRQPLRVEHIKPRLLGHWGTTPGQNFIYAHLNRAIAQYDLDMIYISGPGHGGPALVANTYLEGTYSEVYPAVTRDEAGLQRLFRQFSFPGGIPSHVAPETPGSIHEGGELGYSLSHAFGAVFDNPDSHRRLHHRRR